jgi:hypothetical protein
VLSRCRISVYENILGLWIFSGVRAGLSLLRKFVVIPLQVKRLAIYVRLGLDKILEW